MSLLGNKATVITRGPLKLVIMHNNYYKDVRVLVYANQALCDFSQLPVWGTWEDYSKSVRLSNNFESLDNFDNTDNTGFNESAMDVEIVYDSDSGSYESVLAKTINMRTQTLNMHTVTKFNSDDSRNWCFTNKYISACNCESDGFAIDHNQDFCNDADSELWFGKPILGMIVCPPIGDYSEHFHSIMDDVHVRSRLSLLCETALNYLSDNLDTLTVRRKGQRMTVFEYRSLGFDGLWDNQDDNSSGDLLSSLDSKSQRLLQNGRFAFDAIKKYYNGHVKYDSATVDKFILANPVNGDFANFRKYILGLMKYDRLNISSSNSRKIIEDPSTHILFEHLNKVAPLGTEVESFLHDFDISTALSLGLLDLSCDQILLIGLQHNAADHIGTLKMLIDRVRLFDYKTRLEESLYGNYGSFIYDIFTDNEVAMLEASNLDKEDENWILSDFYKFGKCDEHGYLRYTLLRIFSLDVSCEITIELINIIIGFTDLNTHNNLVDKAIGLVLDNPNTPLDLLMNIYAN